jgi:GDP-L-fucose synthase
MILVTGATGFLGKRVCKKLEQRNADFSKTSLSTGVDLRDFDRCNGLFDRIRPEIVLHCASFVGGIQFGLKHSAEIFKNNLLISVNLFECCAKYGVKRLVNPISNCAYPGNATLFKETEFWDGPLHDSVLTYGMVRKITHVGATAYRSQYGLDTINLILSNMYGPDDHFEEERSHALGALVMKMVEAKRKKQGSVVVWGTGNPVREWLYVDDGAEAMIRACDIPPYKDIINIGVTKGISIKEMAELIQKIVGYEGELVFDSTKPDGAPYKTVDGSRGRQLLNWQPETKFEDGIRITVDWYRANK